MYEQTKQYLQQMADMKIFPSAKVCFFSDETEEILSYGQSVNDNSLFDLASLTKVIGTTTVVLQLIEQHKLLLTDYVCSYLNIKNKKLQIEHLLTHTSDFQGYIPNRNKLNANELKTALLQDIQSGIDLGQKVKYSDINFLYLGWIVEKITKRTIQQVIEDEVLDKLPPNNFTFMPPKSLCMPTENYLQGIVHDPKAQILQTNCGSAGLFGTLFDVLIFAKDYLENNTLLLSSTIQRLNRVYTPINEQSRSLGWVYDNNNLTHTGYTGTYLSINLESREIFIFLSNRVCPVDNKEKYILHRDRLIKIYHSEQNATKYLLNNI